MVQHFLTEVNATVACCLGANQTTAEREPLARHHAVELVLQTLVLAKQIADLTCSNANIAGWHVFIGANVTEQLRHHRLTKAHDLVVAFPFWIEVGTTFSATHREPGQAVFKGLLKAQKLQHAFGNGWVKSQPTFVRADGVIELNSPCPIDSNIPFIISPRDPKRHHSIGLRHSLKNLVLDILWIRVHKWHHRRNEFFNGLVKLWLAWIAFS